MLRVEEREYYSVSEAARLLAVSRTTVWRWIEEGKLPAYRMGGRTIRIRKRDLWKMAQPARGTREGIWSGYDPAVVKSALSSAAGILRGVNTEVLLQEAREGRRQRSGGRPE